MSLSSYCRNCGGPNITYDEMAGNHCNVCEKTGVDAREQALATNPNLSESDLLYIARNARQQNAHHPRKTFINPREFNRANMKG